MHACLNVKFLVVRICSEDTGTLIGNRYGAVERKSKRVRSLIGLGNIMIAYNSMYRAIIKLSWNRTARLNRRNVTRFWLWLIGFDPWHAKSPVQRRGVYRPFMMNDCHRGCHIAQIP